MELSYEKTEQQFVTADNNCTSMKVHTHMEYNTSYVHKFLVQRILYLPFLNDNVYVTESYFLCLHIRIVFWHLCLTRLFYALNN